VHKKSFRSEPIIFLPLERRKIKFGENGYREDKKQNQIWEEGHIMSKDAKNVPIIEADVKCTFSLRIKDDVFRPGRVRVHLPAPINTDWLYMGQVLGSEPKFRMISVEDHPQRSAWFDEVLDENREFKITYAFESAPKTVHFDADEVNKVQQPGEKVKPELIREYEDLSHCDCTSYTGPLADKVTVMDLASETDLKVPGKDEAAAILGIGVGELEELKQKPGNLIKAVFDLCSGEKLCSPKGEKGEVLSRNELLVTLMRSCGVPARWQGGFKLKDGEAIPADWTIVNAEPYGWIYMDAQAAYEAYKSGDSELADFYFGGIDALRVPTASKIGAGHYPAPDYKRSDEKYNLYGEAEFEERGLLGSEFDTTVRIVFDK